MVGRRNRDEAGALTDRTPPDSVRGRLMRAMLIELGRQGYAAMRVEAALASTGVSASRFKSEFGDRDGCLFAAYDDLTARLNRVVLRGCRAVDPWALRVSGGLGRLLDALAADPPLAEVAVRAFPSIGPAAQSRYRAFVEGFAPLLVPGREESGLGDDLPDAVELLAVGAAETIVVEEIDAGRAASLPSLRTDILFSVLVPFLGPQATGEELARLA